VIRVPFVFIGETILKAPHWSIISTPRCWFYAEDRSSEVAWANVWIVASSQSSRSLPFPLKCSTNPLFAFRPMRILYTRDFANC
jgi:hypothetical protein